MADKYVQQIEFKAKIGDLEKKLSKAEKSSKKLSKSFFAAAAALGTVAAVGAKVVQAFAEQEKAERKLEAAFKGNTAALKAHAAQLQENTIFGDEATIQQQAFLASLEFTEDQIKTIIPVAMDLAAATGLSLEGAVRNTAKTFSGLSGELGELVPQLRNLTAEQLKAGEGVEVMGDLFAGQAQAEGDTFAGALAQFSNMFGDFLETVGEGIAPFVTSMAGGFESIVRSAQSLISNSPADEFERQASVLKSTVAALGMYDKDSNVRLELIKEIKKEYPDFNRMVQGEFDNLELVNQQLEIYTQHAQSKVQAMREEATLRGIQEALGQAYADQAEGTVALTAAWGNYGQFVEDVLKIQLKEALDEGKISFNEWNDSVSDLDAGQGTEDLSTMLDILRDFPFLTKEMEMAVGFSMKGMLGGASESVSLMGELGGAFEGTLVRLQGMDATQISNTLTKVKHGFELLGMSMHTLHGENDAITISLNQSTKRLKEYEEQVKKESQAIENSILLKKFLKQVQDGTIIDEKALQNMDTYNELLNDSELSLKDVIAAFEEGGNLAGILQVAQQYEESNKIIQAANNTFTELSSKRIDSITLEISKKQEQIDQMNLLLASETEMEEQRAEAIKTVRSQLLDEIDVLNKKFVTQDEKLLMTLAQGSADYGRSVGSILGSISQMYGMQSDQSKDAALAQIDCQKAQAIANFAAGTGAAFSKGATPLAFLEATALAAQMAVTLTQLKEAKELVNNTDYTARQTGGSFIAENPTMMMVGEEGSEAVSVTPLDQVNAGAGGGGATIVFNNPIMTDEIIESEIIPKIQQAINRGESIDL